MKITRHTNKYYVCKRFRMLKFLVSKGFYPIEVMPNADNPRHNVWRFVNDDNFQDAVQEYFQMILNKEN